MALFPCLGQNPLSYFYGRVAHPFAGNALRRFSREACYRDSRLSKAERVGKGAKVRGKMPLR